MCVEDFDLSLIFHFLHDLISHSGHSRVMEGAVMCVQNITTIFSNLHDWEIPLCDYIKS